MLMQGTKVFIIKERRQTSLIWLLCVLGTLILWIIWSFYAIFFTADYQENTSSLRKSAPSFFTDVSKLSYPSDATLEHISTLKLGPNFSENLFPLDKLSIENTLYLFFFKNFFAVKEPTYPSPPVINNFESIFRFYEIF